MRGVDDAYRVCSSSVEIITWHDGEDDTVEELAAIALSLHRDALYSGYVVPWDEVRCSHVGLFGKVRA